MTEGEIYQTTEGGETHTYSIRCSEREWKAMRHAAEKTMPDELKEIHDLRYRLAAEKGLAELKGSHEHVALSDEETGLEQVARWVREYKAKLLATGGIFDSGLRCVSDGGEIFFIDPEEIEEVMARLDAQTVTLERLREALNRLVLTEKRRHSCPDCAQGPGQAHLRSCPIGRALLLADEDALSAPVSAGEALLRAAREFAKFESTEQFARDASGELVLDVKTRHRERLVKHDAILTAHRAELAERGGK